MMVWVSRGASGAVNGIFANRQEGYAEEQLDSGNAEVVAFLNPPPPVPTISKAQALIYLLMIGKTEADVDVELAKIADPRSRSIATIEWKHRQPFHYDHQLFVEICPRLGITDRPAAFRIAATL